MAQSRIAPVAVALPLTHAVAYVAYVSLLIWSVF
jgi:hypothetical protein